MGVHSPMNGDVNGSAGRAGASDGAKEGRRQVAPPYLSLSVGEAMGQLAASPPAEPEPQDHGTVMRLLAHRARYSPDVVAVGFPDEGGRPCPTWTYRNLTRMGTSAARQLCQALLRQGLPAKSQQPVIALLGPSGPGYLAQALGCWHAGAAILPIALGTTASGVANLLRLTGCKCILAHVDQRDLAEAAAQHSDLRQDVQLFDWLSCGDAAEENTDVTPLYPAGPDDVIVIFHSSGSSGNPKPIPQLHRFWTKTLFSARGRDRAAFTTTPLFHGGLSDLFRAFQAAAPIYFYPWHLRRAPTTATIVASVQACTQEIRYFLSVPMILESLMREKLGINLLKDMDLVSTGGAPLPQHVGDDMVQHHNIRLVSRLGSSECGFLMSSWRDFDNDKEWSWLRVTDQTSEQWLKFQARSEHGEGLHELIVSSYWPTKIISNQSDGSFASGDLFQRHPVDSGKWRYARRSDDSIVLVNGKKVASSPIEVALKNSRDLVSDAIVFGASRPSLGVLILPSALLCSRISASQQGTEEEKSVQMLAALLPTLESVNKTQPSHARIPPEMVYFMQSDRFSQLPRSSKGTLQRGMAMDQLAGIIDGVYRRFERGEAPQVQPRLALKGKELNNWVHSLIEEILGHDIDDGDDFFDAGVDSIMAARIRAALLQRLDLQGSPLASNVVYEHSNINNLCSFLDDPIAVNAERNAANIARDLVERHSRFSVPLETNNNFDGALTFLVTGGTGALGSRILDQLLQLPKSQVASVYCLARADNDDLAQARLLRALRARNCSSSLEDGQVQGRLVAKATLDDETRVLLRDKTRRLVIIHCAWTVNFALSLASFEKDCIASLKDLLDLFRSSRGATRFVFCSSLASIMQSPSQVKDEIPSSDVSSAGQTGYGQSKWVAEQICQASHSSDRPVTIARVGQLCGDTKHGIWNETEAWPLLVRTANEVGSLPATGPAIDWLPVDVAAKAIIDIALSTTTSPIAHVTTPMQAHRPSWSDFLHWLRSSGVRFDVKTNEEWLDQLKAAGTKVRGRALIDDIWATLQDASREDISVSSVEAEAASTTLAKATTVDESLCRKFVNAWRANGFLE
ncbi:acetyl-CoA synthetase-like protein [Acaromyces ingoldii]|uniref:Acetyl-CoA synthetase-like protein n=1 Tax=Acaromyces ingoldii TaxID=215250 RepID=A0A316YFH5_9BASI|nr:acetyl-CoA synthetase-like protein [Acaromyces ingoldii]PWN87368.1 acetyl-CoA synthetase-like protein [Acaromyces ingoldii]